MLPFRFFCGNGDSSIAGLQMEMLTYSTDFVLGSIGDLSPFSPKKAKRVTGPGHEAGPQHVSF